MMKEMFILALKAAGLATKYADLIPITEESQIEGIVNDLKNSVDTSAPKLPDTLDGVLNSNKEFQAEFDRRVAKAIATSKSNQQQTPPPTPPGGQNGENQNKELSELKQLVVSLAESVKTTQETALKTQQQSSAKEKFAKTKLPGGWFDRIDTAGDVDQQISALQKEADEFKQSIIDEQIANGDYTPSGKGGVEDSVLTEYIKEKNAEPEAGGLILE